MVAVLFSSSAESFTTKHQAVTVSLNSGNMLQTKKTQPTKMNTSPVINGPRYTLCLKKVIDLMYDNNFEKCGLVFKIPSPIYWQGNSLCRPVHGKDCHFTCNMLLQFFF